MFCLTERTMKRPQSEQAAAVSTNKDQTRTNKKRQKEKARFCELLWCRWWDEVDKPTKAINAFGRYGSSLHTAL